MSVEAATSATVFHAYLDDVLLPALRRTRPDAVLVMDNLRAHKAPRVRALLDRSGFTYRYLPAYSPDFTPIEPAWAKVKAELRRRAARTAPADRKSTRLNSSHANISYAVFCLKKKKKHEDEIS